MTRSGQYNYGTTVLQDYLFSSQDNSIKDKYAQVLKGHIAVVVSNIKKYDGKNRRKAENF